MVEPYFFWSCALSYRLHNKDKLIFSFYHRCPGPVGNGAIFEEGAVQQSAAAAAGVQADLPELPQACGDLAQALLDAQADDANAN